VRAARGAGSYPSRRRTRNANNTSQSTYMTSTASSWEPTAVRARIFSIALLRCAATVVCRVVDMHTRTRSSPLLLPCVCLWNALSEKTLCRGLADTVSKVDGKTLHLGMMYRFVTSHGGYWAVRAFHPRLCPATTPQRRNSELCPGVKGDGQHEVGGSEEHVPLQ
jgi:hypothetical protein